MNNVIFIYMRNIIRAILKEAFGDGRKYRTGANYFTSDQLILMAYSNKQAEAYRRENPDDLKGLFNLVWNAYVSDIDRWNLPEPREDKETIMYDFMAHYKPDAEDV